MARAPYHRAPTRAVGSHGKWTTIERWKGKAWKVQPSPSPGSGLGRVNVLDGVAATFSTNAWAVGDSFINSAGGPLIERWNG